MSLNLRPSGVAFTKKSTLPFDPPEVIGTLVYPVAGTDLTSRSRDERPRKIEFRASSITSPRIRSSNRNRPPGFFRNVSARNPRFAPEDRSTTIAVLPSGMWPSMTVASIR